METCSLSRCVLGSKLVIHQHFLALFPWFHGTPRKLSFILALVLLCPGRFCMWVRANVYLHDLLLWLYGLHDPLQMGHTHARSTKHHQLHDRPWVQKCKSLWRPETILLNNILHMIYIMWFINMQLVFAQFYSRYVKRGYRIWIHTVLDSSMPRSLTKHSETLWALQPISKFEAMAMWSEDSNPMFGHIVPQMLMGICMLAVPWMLLPSWICAAVFFGVMHLSSCLCLDLSLRIPKPIILNRRNQAHWALHEVSAFWTSGILVWAPRFI